MKKDKKKLVENKAGLYDIPVEGSLGLLALGAVGLKAWRDKRNESKPTIKGNSKKL